MRPDPPAKQVVSKINRSSAEPSQRRAASKVLVETQESSRRIRGDAAAGQGRSEGAGRDKGTQQENPRTRPRSKRTPQRQLQPNKPQTRDKALDQLESLAVGARQHQNVGRLDDAG